MKIAIVGGGAAGTFTAFALARLAQGHLITIFESGPNLARGVAYSARFPGHRINVPAAKMGGIFEGDTNGFVDWLVRHGFGAQTDAAAAFAPRQLYGDYLHDNLAAALAEGRIAVVAQEVVALARTPEGTFRLETRDGSRSPWDAVVLSTGHLPPAHAWPVAVPVKRDIWAPGALDDIASSQSVLILGTGATAIDAVLSLLDKGHIGPITLVSRRGLVPRIDRRGEACADVFRELPGAGVRDAMRRLRHEAKAATGRGLPWQVVIDAVRPYVRPVWEAWSDVERRRFLRHAASHWLVHRHRLPPDLAAHLDRLCAAGRIEVVAGRLARSDRDDSVRILTRTTGQPRDVQIDALVDCTGPSLDFKRAGVQLYDVLFAAGLCRAAPLGLGLDVDRRARLVDAHGAPTPGLYVVGSATRGCFWEITAATSIRKQAEAVAADLMAETC